MPENMIELGFTQLPNFAGLLVCVFVLWRQNRDLMEIIKTKCLWVTEAPAIVMDDEKA